jgi:flagellar hook-associated protein FlgK
MASLGLNTGLKALLTAQSKLETIGHNLSNASTPGYSRQSLEISSSPTLRIRGLVQGTGVQADTVRRTVDALLTARLATQTSVASRLGARVGGLSEVEALLGNSPGGGLDQLFKKFFGSLSQLSTTPDDSLLRGGAVQSAVDISDKFRQLAGGSKSLVRDTISRVELQVTQVNQLAERISRLNKQISGSEFASGTANDLRDAREQALSQLAELVDVRAVEDAGGAMRVLVGGQTLVTAVGFKQMETVGDHQTQVSLRVKGSAVDADVSGGSIGGLLSLLRHDLPDMQAKADGLARNLILELNRAHSVGLPAGGPMRFLVGANALKDQDNDGQVNDELLSRAGLDFQATKGELFVNVTNTSTGQLEKHRVPIDPDRTTVQDFLNALSAIPHLSASVDGQGRVQMQADSGYGFDFSPRLDPAPDNIGSFGGGQASLASANAEPFAIGLTDTLDFSTPLGAISVGFQPTQFQKMSQATAAELASALNADAGFQSGGLIASSVGGALVVQTVGSGTAENFTVTSGTANAALGWTPGTSVQGKSLQVSPQVSGSYSGAANDAWTFRPSGDGTIGSTVGLKINVFDKNGAQIAQLDVGSNYQPGSELEVRDGVKLAFGLGDVSQSNNDLFRLDVLADSDTADVLPALGLNTLFTGNDASTIAVRGSLIDNPSLFAASASGASGDAGNVLRLLQLGDSAISGLQGRSFDNSVADWIGGVALELSNASDAAASEDFMQQSLQSRKDQISGVNVDEELAQMIVAQQAYSAAGEYLRVVNQLSNELFNII